MHRHARALPLAALSCALLACTMVACSGADPRGAAPGSAAVGADPELSAFIGSIRAVDNHAHANSVTPADSDADALPLDGIPFELPVPLRADNPAWLAAYQAMYNYPHPDLSEPHLGDLRASMQRMAKTQGDSFPQWVLQQTGSEVVLANRIAMGPGLRAPHFRWVSFADALIFPLSTATEAASSPDRAKLFPLEAKLLQRYLVDRGVARLPPTLAEYAATVVTPTLESQQQGGCVAVKFEAAYLRALDFDTADSLSASRIYARYVNGGEPTRAEYKTLQDWLFRYVAREAGRLGMAVHIHSFEGFGNGYRAAGADPLLLESAFTDPALQGTNFVIVHGGGVYSSHTAAMLWKPNVYADISMMTLAYTPSRLGAILRMWLTQYPGKILYGSDAVALGPEMGWEISAWVASRHGREALALALSDMLRHGEVTRERAHEIAIMVMRTNAGGLYKLGFQ
ncbi:MAG: amidohydrolase [Gemmatimonadota bacterium]